MHVVYKKSFEQRFREMLWEHDRTDRTKKIDYVQLTRNEVGELYDGLPHLVTLHYGPLTLEQFRRTGRAHFYGIEVRWEPF